MIQPTLSKIFRSEAVANSKRKTNGAKVYYPCLIVGGRDQPALSSDSQILVAIQRAEQQPEDVPKVFKIQDKFTYPKWKLFICKLIGVNV